MLKPKAPKELTLEQLMADLQEAAKSHVDRPVGFHTVQEIVKQTGQHERKVREMLNVAKDLGRLETDRVKLPRVDGLMKTVSVFKILSN